MAIGHSREAEADLEMAFAADGTIVALKGEIFCNIGAYMRPNGTTAVRNVAQFLTGPYRVPNFEIRSHALVTNKTPAGTYRGPGRYEASFFFERMLDIAAGDLGLDQLEIRRRNLISRDEIPFKMVKIGPADGWDDTYLDSGDYLQGFDACLRQARWADKAALQGKLIDGRYHGLGVAWLRRGRRLGSARACAHGVTARRTYRAGRGFVVDRARHRDDFRADRRRRAGDRDGSDHGAAWFDDAARRRFRLLRLARHGDGRLRGDRRRRQSCSAAFRASAALRLDVDGRTLALADGLARAPDGRSIALADVQADNLVVDGVFHNSKPTFTYGTGVAHVAVDPGTGHVEVIDYTVVDDVGRIINPETLHGQVLGAVIQGMGSVFSEHLVYDGDGQLLVGSLADYQIPHATDYPEVHCVSTELHPSPNNPLGAKGAGEGGVIPVGAAVVNAVANALASLGVEPNALPITAPRLWEMIEVAAGSRQ